MAQAILVINAGSKELRFSLYRAETLRRMCRGQVTEMCNRPFLRVHDSADRLVHEEEIPAPPMQISLLDRDALHSNIEDATRHYPAVVKAITRWLDAHEEELRLAAVCHRVAHGGRIFDKPVIVNAFVMGELESLVPLAPLHQPGNLEAIRQFMKRYALVPHVAFFDTAFHHTIPEVARHYALPKRLRLAGIERYGFDGLAYEFIAWSLPQYLKGEGVENVIVAHLGRGASLCALKGGVSVATTMGFTSLDGLVMGTRCGDLDPGAVLYMLRDLRMTPDHAMQVLYYESGLKALAGDDDLRRLLESDKPEAQTAVEMYVHQIVRHIGMMAADLGGMDALVFTGGVGERSDVIRARVCERLAWLGVALDDKANSRHQPHLAAEGSRVEVLAIPTDEEMMMAMQALDLLEKQNNMEESIESSVGVYLRRKTG